MFRWVALEKKAASRANLWTFNYIFFAAAVWKHGRIEWRRAWWKLSNLLRSFLITFCSIFSPVSSRRERLNLDLFTMGDKVGRTFQLSTRQPSSEKFSGIDRQAKKGVAKAWHKLTRRSIPRRAVWDFDASSRTVSPASLCSREYKWVFSHRQWVLI